MEYLDTGGRDPNHALHTWLEARLADATRFESQTGYFSADGLFPFEAEVRRMLDGGGEFHLVVGANESSLRSADIEYVVDLIEPYAGQASLVVVGARGALMHPKTYYLESVGGRRAAAIGSSNLTRPGLTANIEAVIALDSDSDPNAPFDEIHAAIEQWRTGARPQAIAVTRDEIPRLIADGVLDAPRPERPPLPPGVKRRLVRRFPRVAPLLRLPSRRGPGTRRAARTRALALRLGVAQPLPTGQVGIVKKLSREDSKGFRGATGTAYIALPKALVDHLPMTPYGRNSTPRVDVGIEARLLDATGHVVVSGEAQPNITYVGVGGSSPSNPDLRLNLTKTIVDGLLSAAGEAGVSPPSPGDPVAIEFLPGVRVRLTFVTAGRLHPRLLALCTQSRGSWGWLPDTDAPAW